MRSLDSFEGQQLYMELPPAKVPAWLSQHGYDEHGNRKPATVSDDKAGQKYAELLDELLSIAAKPMEEHMLHSALGRLGSIRGLAMKLQRLDEKGGGT
jgi:hypothetical protein